MITGRALMAAIADLAIAPLAQASPGTGKRAQLGYLAQGAAPLFNRLQGPLRDHGWREGENLRMVFRLWGEHPERARVLAVDRSLIIASPGNDSHTRSNQRPTRPKRTR